MSPIRVEDASLAQQEKQRNEADVKTHFGGTIIDQVDQIYITLFEASKRTIRDAAQSGVPQADWPDQVIAFTNEEKLELLTLTQTISLFSGPHPSVTPLMELVAREILAAPTQEIETGTEENRQRLFQILSEHVRKNLAIPEFLNGVDAVAYNSLPADEKRRVIDDITHALLAMQRSRLQYKEGGRGQLSVPDTVTWFMDGEFWVPAVETAINANPTYLALKEGLPTEVKGAVEIGENRLIAINVMHNLAAKIQNLGNTKVKAKQIIDVFKGSDLRTANNPYIFEQLFSRDVSPDKQARRYERSSTNLVDWDFASFARLGLALQDRAMNGLPEQTPGGPVSIPAELPFFASQPDRMFTTISDLNEQKYRDYRTAVASPVVGDLPKRTADYLKWGTQQSFVFNRATLMEMGYDVKAMEHELSQFFNARNYYDIYTGAKTVESPITGRKVGPDTGRVRPRYGMPLPEYLQMYALVPEDAITISDDFDAYFNTYLPSRYPDADKRKKSKEYINAVGGFTREEWRDGAGGIDYAALSRKYVIIQVNQDYRIFKDRSEPDKIILPRQRLERIEAPVAGAAPKVYYRIQAPLHDLVVKSRLAEIDPNTKDPMILFQTTPIEPVVNYDALLEYENSYWHALATVESSADTQVWQDINKTEVQVVWNPGKFLAQLKRAGQRFNIGLRRNVSVLNFVNKGNKEFGGLNKAGGGHKKFVERLQSDLQTEMFVPDDAVSIHDMDHFGFFTFFDSGMKYFIDKLEAGNPADIPIPEFDPITGDLKAIDFEKFSKKKKDLSILRTLFRDASDSKESSAFFTPYRMDYWIKQYESDSVPLGTVDVQKYKDKKKFDAKLGLFYELLIHAYMLYLNRYMLSEVEGDRSLANYKEIRIDTTSGYDALTPDKRARLVEVMYQYMIRMTQQLVNEEEKRHGHSLLSKKEAIEYMEGLGDHSIPFNPNNQNTWWYSRNELMTNLRYLMRRAGVEGSFESGVVDLQWLEAKKLDTMPTISEYNKQKQDEHKKK